MTISPVINQPYPTSEKTPMGLLLSGLIPGVLLAVFLIVFQPFGTDAVDFPGKTAFLAGYGVIVASTIWALNILPARFFGAERWTVGKQIVLVLTGIFLAVTASYFYVLQLGGTASWVSYRIFVVNAMSIVAIPVVGMVLIDFYLKFRKYDGGARSFNLRPPAEPKATATAEEVAPAFAITDDQDRPVLTLSADKIWNLRSDRNYVDVFHLNADGAPAKTTVRNTLTRLTKEMPAGFLRCHRSYVVNPDRVVNVSGNAQGYRLHSPDFPDTPVPVSRGKSAEVLAVLRKLDG